MAVGAYLVVEELGRDKEMAFVGVDGLGGPAGGIRKLMDGVLAATFVYPLCADKAAEIGNRILHEANFHPEKWYDIPSEMASPANAAEIYTQLTVAA